MKSKAVLTRQQRNFAFVDKTSFFTDLVTVCSIDFDWLIPFTSNNVKESIAKEVAKYNKPMKLFISKWHTPIKMQLRMKKRKNLMASTGLKY